MTKYTLSEAPSSSNNPPLPPSNTSVHFLAAFAIWVDSCSKIARWLQKVGFFKNSPFVADQS